MKQANRDERKRQEIAALRQAMAALSAEVDRIEAESASWEHWYELRSAREKVAQAAAVLGNVEPLERLGIRW